MSKNVGDYMITTKLGSGSFATVSLARHTGTGEYKAIKVIARDRLSGKLMENLECEIRILKNFRHPNIVELYEIKKSERNIYLVLEYCEGGDLHKFIKAHGRLKEGVAQVFMGHLAAGLKFLWEKNLIHRDLKPQNLLLTKPKGGTMRNADDGTLGFVLKIADFGFARHLAVAMMAETLCGSPLYMAPEILEGKKYDAKADLWSVGTILFEMVVGRPPYGGSSSNELLKNINRRSLYIPEDIAISENCVNVLKMLLKRQPLHRASFETFFSSEFIEISPKITQDSPKNQANDQEPPPQMTPVQPPIVNEIGKSSTSFKSSRDGTGAVYKDEVNVAMTGANRQMSQAHYNPPPTPQQTRTFKPLTASPPTTQPMITVMGANFGSGADMRGPFSKHMSQIPPLSQALQDEVHPLAGSDDFVIVERSSGNVNESKHRSVNPMNPPMGYVKGRGNLGGMGDLEGVLRCLQFVEVFGRRAVLLAQLGDANVVTALRSYHSSYIAAHIANAKASCASLMNITITSQYNTESDSRLANTIEGQVAIGNSGIDAISNTKPLFERVAVGMSIALGLGFDMKCEYFGGNETPLDIPREHADGTRLFGEALVLYLKSLSMIKTAITWARQTLDGLKQDISRGSDPPSSPQDVSQQLLTWGESLQLWLAQQFSAVLDRSEQCNEKLKSSSDDFANSTMNPTSNNDPSRTVYSMNALPSEKTLSAEQLIFQGALKLARDGAVSEVLGQFREGQERLEKAALLVETLLLDGTFGGAKMSTSEYSPSSFQGVGGLDRQSLQKYLDTLLLSAEGLGRKYQHVTNSSDPTSTKM